MHYTKVFFKHRYTLHCITGFSQLDIFCLILIEEHFCYLMRDSYSGYIFLEGGGMSMVTCMSTTKTAVHVYEILDQKKFRAPAWMRPRAPVGHLFVCLG